MNSKFWIVETLRIEILPKYGHHWHIVFSDDRPAVKVIAGPFNSDAEAVAWLNSHADQQPQPTN
jgi:hypothetical protein